MFKWRTAYFSLALCIVGHLLPLSSHARLEQERYWTLLNTIENISQDFHQYLRPGYSSPRPPILRFETPSQKLDKNLVRYVHDLSAMQFLRAFELFFEKVESISRRIGPAGVYDFELTRCVEVFYRLSRNYTFDRKEFETVIQRRLAFFVAEEDNFLLTRRLLQLDKSNESKSIWKSIHSLPAKWLDSEALIESRSLRQYILFPWGKLKEDGMPNFQDQAKIHLMRAQLMIDIKNQLNIEENGTTSYLEMNRAKSGIDNHVKNLTLPFQMNRQKSPSHSGYPEKKHIFALLNPIYDRLHSEQYFELVKYYLDLIHPRSRLDGRILEDLLQWYLLSRRFRLSTEAQVFLNTEIKVTLDKLKFFENEVRSERYNDLYTLLKNRVAQRWGLPEMRLPRELYPITIDRGALIHAIRMRILELRTYWRDTQNQEIRLSDEDALVEEIANRILTGPEKSLGFQNEKEAIDFFDNHIEYPVAQMILKESRKIRPAPSVLYLDGEECGRALFPILGDPVNGNPN